MKFIIALGVAAVVVLLIFLYGLFGVNEAPESVLTSDETTDVESVESVSTEEEQVFRGEAYFEEIKQLGNNLECRIVYDAPDQATPVTGTYFVSGERIRADFEMIVPELGGPVVSSIIFDDDMYYSWSNINGQLYGVSANINAMTEIDQDSLNEPVSADDRVSYECTKWQVVDGSIFEPPSNVLFQDLTNVLNSGMEYGTIYTEGEF